MRILIISDIHANMTALDTVLSAAGEFDAAWCLGDLVGYGPDPNEVIERIRQLPDLLCLIGNHDAAALNQIDTGAFNPEARQAVQWTQKNLSEGSVSFLRSLPEKLVTEEVTLSHGSPRYPVWEYLLDTRSAQHNFDYFDTPYCFVGHTHLPVIYSLDGKESNTQISIPEPNTIIKLTWRSIVNPGSVGQPRDRDIRAAFAIYDSDENTWDYRRVTYDITAVQVRMVKAGLPERHIQRLSAGW
jgi:diadenosine tetraphosphatase ApaH/serine/threonine PP2A family protein phosphatase